MNKEKFEQVIFICLLLIGIGFGYYKFVLSNQLSDIADGQKRLQEVSALKGQIDQIKASKQETIQQTNKVKKELETINKLLPEKMQLTDFNFQLYKELKKRGLTTKNLTTLKKKSTSGYNMESISINFEGPKDKALEFIKYLQENPRKVKISEVTINIKDTKVVAVNLYINIYSMSN